MPLYDYQCSSCGHSFSSISSVADRAVPEALPCKECQSISVKIQIGAPKLCSANRMDCTSSSKPGGDFKERWAQIRSHFKKDKASKLPDF